MRAVIYGASDGEALNAVELPDGWTVDADGLTARGPAERLEDGEVVEFEGVFAAPAGARLAAHPEAGPGWTLDGEAWVAPAPSPEQLAAHAVQRRWETMNGGILFDGFAIPTDDIGRGLVNGAWNKANDDPGHSKRWQVSNAPIAFTTFSNAQLIALGLAVEGMVQAAFDVLDQVADEIAEGGITTYAQIDAAFAAVDRVFTS